jgi:hypothetical protein
MIGRRISRACERLKLNEKKSALSIDRFAHPRAAESNAQLSLF